MPGFSLSGALSLRALRQSPFPVALATAPSDAPAAAGVGNMLILERLSVRASEGDSGMFRLLSIVALGALCLLAGRASADPLRPHASEASDISSREPCACTWRRPTRVVHYRRYRLTHYTRYRSISAIYPIGYDPLPYRFGYFPEPYRYRHRVAILTSRPYRYYR
jgi:hypothetical protein